jgi:CrcB protein
VVTAKSDGGRGGDDGPIHPRLPGLGLVWLGGALGTTARYLLSEATPALSQRPLVTFLINIGGAFLLGVLLTGLARAGSDQAGRRALRLFAGTGFLGGFTTYSALAVDAAGLLDAGAVELAVAYALGTVLLGAAASMAGIAVASGSRGTGGRT